MTGIVAIVFDMFIENTSDKLEIICVIDSEVK